MSAFFARAGCCSVSPCATGVRCSAPPAVVGGAVGAGGAAAPAVGAGGLVCGAAGDGGVVTIGGAVEIACGPPEVMPDVSGVDGSKRTIPGSTGAAGAAGAGGVGAGGGDGWTCVAAVCGLMAGGAAGVGAGPA